MAKIHQFLQKKKQEKRAKLENVKNKHEFKIAYRTHIHFYYVTGTEVPLF